MTVCLLMLMLKRYFDEAVTGDVSLSVNKHCGRASGEEMVYPSRHERKRSRTTFGKRHAWGK